MKKTIGKSPLAAYLSKSDGSKKNESVASAHVQSQPKEVVNQTSIISSASNKDKPLNKEMIAAKEELFVAPNNLEQRQIKQRVTIHIPVNLTERIKNAVYWEPGLTVAGFCEQALLKAIEKLEKEKGQPYPSRREQLRGGRPLK